MAHRPLSNRIVKIRILPSSPDAGHLQHLVSFVIDGHLAIDAGCIGLCGPPGLQAEITTVVLTHSHLDHVCSLPMFAMNVIDSRGRGIVVSAPAPVLDSLRQDLFNWRLWPDFTSLKIDGRPLVQLAPLEPRRPTAFGGLTVTAIPVNHPVPTVAYLVEDDRSAVVFALDTGPTEEIWEVAARTPHVTTAFVDVAFPDEMSTLAEASGHMTPSLARTEMSRLPVHVRKIASHLKPAYYDRIIHQLDRLAIPNLSIGCPGHEYDS
jgi:ribonuclease BN (tRNA processing enzyme)